jgi:hypothetical protein
MEGAFHCVGKAEHYTLRNGTQTTSPKGKKIDYKILDGPTMDTTEGRVR